MSSIGDGGSDAVQRTAPEKAAISYTTIRFKAHRQRKKSRSDF